MPEIFLNCDLGERQTAEQTAALMSHLDMANIACGSHAGDLQSIIDCASLAEKRHPIAVSTGALPGINSEDHDRILPENLSIQSFKNLLEIQIQRYISAADLNHIKLHRSLYHLTENDEDFRKSYLDFVRNNCLISVVCLAGGEVAAAAEKRGIPILPEVFLDRHYAADGRLLPRTQPDACISDISEILKRLELLTQSNCLIAHDGSKIEIPEHYDCLTACVNSDSPDSLDILAAAKKYLNSLNN